MYLTHISLLSTEDKGEGEGEGGDIPESGEGEEEEKEPSGVNVDEGAAADLNPPSADVAPPAGSNPPSPVQEPNPETGGVECLSIRDRWG